MSLPYTITGPDDAPAVLLLHGFMGAADDWAPVAAALAGDLRCIAVDLPGHGDATGLSEEAYTVEGTLAALVDTLDALDVQRCHVVGYSMGGRLALLFALRHPERCSRLVLASASPGLKTEVERAERCQTDADRAAAIETEFDAFLDAWARLPIFALDGAEPRQAFIDRRQRNIPAELARSLRGFGTGQQPSLWPELESLAVPTLAVAGGRDRKYADLAFEMAAVGPPVMPLIVPAGHAVHTTQPALFADLVRDFFRAPISSHQPVLS